MTPYEHHIDLRQVAAAVGLLAVECSHDAIIAKGFDGTIISWNPAAERMFGYIEAEAVGSPAAMLVPGDRHGEDETVLARIRDGGAVEHYESIRVAKDGKRVDVSLTVAALRDHEGRLIGVSKIMRDITQAIDARRAQQRLAALIESSDDAILSKDTQGRITSWNPAARTMFGYEAEEVIGQHGSMLFPPDLIGHERDILGEILQGRKVDHYETRRQTRDGRILDVSLTVSPLRDPDGTVIGASKVLRDISDRSRIAEQERRALELVGANREFAAADRLKDQLLAMANHELRTPLTSIAGFTRTLLDLDDQIDAERRREFLEIIASQVARLERMVEGMLTLGRLELQTLEARPERIGVRAATQRVLRESAHEDVLLDAPEDDELAVFADPDHFQQMVLNYVDNASKYGSAPICVEVEARDDNIVICVSDRGPGVEDGFEDRLFDRFSRGADHVALGVSGTGLGLSIVRGLAQAQGGDAWHERNEPDGARFCLRLPRARAEVPAPA